MHVLETVQLATELAKEMVWLTQMPVNAVKSATIPITVFGKLSVRTTKMGTRMIKMRMKKIIPPTKMIDDCEQDR